MIVISFWILLQNLFLISDLIFCVIQQLKKWIIELNTFIDAYLSASHSIVYKANETDCFVVLTSDEFVKILSVCGDNFRGIPLEFWKSLTHVHTARDILEYAK